MPIALLEAAPVRPPNSTNDWPATRTACLRANAASSTAGRAGSRSRRSAADAQQCPSQDQHRGTPSACVEHHRVPDDEQHCAPEGDARARHGVAWQPRGMPSSVEHHRIPKTNRHARRQIHRRGTAASQKRKTIRYQGLECRQNRRKIAPAPQRQQIGRIDAIRRIEGPRHLLHIIRHPLV